MKIKSLSKENQLKIIRHFKSDKKKQEKECHELWREICFKRAKEKCEYQNCRQPATQPHHIKTKGHCRHLRFDPDNSMALCYYHHKGRDGAHSDINFKDKILGKYEGFRPIRSEQWFILLERKASVPQKQDLKLEKLFLENELKKYV